MSNSESSFQSFKIYNKREGAQIYFTKPHFAYKCFASIHQRCLWSSVIAASGELCWVLAHLSAHLGQFEDLPGTSGAEQELPGHSHVAFLPVQCSSYRISLFMVFCATVLMIGSWLVPIFYLLALIIIFILISTTTLSVSSWICSHGAWEK